MKVKYTRCEEDLNYEFCTQNEICRWWQSAAWKILPLK